MSSIFLTSALFLFPGALLLFHQKIWPNAYFVEKLPIAVAASLAWWIIGFWFLRIVPLPLSLFVSLSLTYSVIAFGFLIMKTRKRQRAGTSDVGINIGILLFFLALGIPAVIIATRHLAPVGQDMSMHAYLAKQIFLSDGFPKTLRPLVPLDQFGFYPVGFPAIIANMMIVNRLPVYTNALWLTAFTYWFFALSLYSLLRQRYSVFVSCMVTVLVSWVNARPNDIMEWGSNPTILSFDFLILAVAFVMGKNRHRSLLLSFILFSAAFLTHYMLPIAFLYLFIFLVLFFAGEAWSHIQTMQPFSVLCLTLLLIAPFLWHMHYFTFHLSEGTKMYVAGLQRDDLTAWAGAPGWEVARASIQFISETFSKNVLILYALSWLLMLAVNKRHALMHVVYVGGLMLLVINSRYWLIPLSSILYPDRIILLAILPLSLGIAEGLTIGFEGIYTHFVIHNRRNFALLHVLAVLILLYVYGPAIRISYQRFLTANKQGQVIAPSDIAAFSWLKEHTTPTDVIMNNYNDAGIWIPAIAERAITTYQTNPIDRDALEKNLLKPTYAYIGSMSLTREPGVDPVNEEITNNPQKYTLVYSNDGVRIYRVSK